MWTLWRKKRASYAYSRLPLDHQQFIKLSNLDSSSPEEGYSYYADHVVVERVFLFSFANHSPTSTLFSVHLDLESGRLKSMLVDGRVPELAQV